MHSLLNQIGGEEALSGVIESFHQKLFSDPVTAHFFLGVDPEKLHHKQMLFLTMVLCGEVQGVAGYMMSAHERLVKDMGLCEHHFDRTVELLKESLEQADIEPDLVAAIVALTKGLKDAVLSRINLKVSDRGNFHPVPDFQSRRKD